MATKRKNIYKVAEKSLRHLLFFDFLHERPLMIDIQMLISVAFEIPEVKIT